MSSIFIVFLEHEFGAHYLGAYSTLPKAVARVLSARRERVNQEYVDFQGKPLVLPPPPPPWDDYLIVLRTMDTNANINLASWDTAQIRALIGGG